MIPSSTAPPAFFEGSGPRLLGHRGYCGRHLENTLAAFDAALSEGAQGVELDVRLTRDGVPFVLHDSDLSRTTRGRYTDQLIELSSTEVQALDLPAGERIPSLSEALDWAVRRSALLNVELKSEHGGELLVSRVAEELKASGLPVARVVLSSFELPSVELLLETLPQYAIALLIETLAPSLEVWLTRVEADRVGGGPRLIHPDLKLVTSGLAAHWRERGLRLGLWGIDTLIDVQRALSFGADLLIADQPRLVSQLATAAPVV